MRWWIELTPDDDSDEQNAQTAENPQPRTETRAVVRIYVNVAISAPRPVDPQNRNSCDRLRRLDDLPYN